MPQIRPASALRAAKSLSTTASAPTVSSSPFITTSNKLGAARAFSQTKSARAADHAHESHYEPPSGWLFGVKPGEKAEKEGWENVWIYGFFGSLGLTVVAYAFKPDTSIQTWALEEARRRLEVEGILKEPESKS